MTDEKRGLASFFKADVSDLMKGAGKVLRTDIGGLLRTNSPNADTSPHPELPPDENTSTKLVAKSNTNSINNKASSADDAKSIFANKRIQTPEEKLAALGDDDDGTSQRVRINTKLAQTAGDRLDEATQLRQKRVAPKGNAAAVLLPNVVGAFAREPGQPQGDIAHDPAQATYTSHYGNVQLLVEITWSSSEARECLAHLATQMGESPAAATEQQWLLGQLNDGTVFAWCRENYYFRATSAGGGAVLVPFLTEFPY